MSGRSHIISLPYFLQKCEAVSHHPHLFFHFILFRPVPSWLCLRCSSHGLIVKVKLGGWRSSSGRRRSFFMGLARRRRGTGQTKKRLAGLVGLKFDWMMIDPLLFAIFTHTVFQSSSHEAYCNGQVYKHVPKKFTIARHNLTSMLPMSSFCSTVVKIAAFSWSCPLFSLGCNWLDIFWKALLSICLAVAVNEETACNFGFLNEPSSWLGTGNPSTGQVSYYWFCVVALVENHQKISFSVFLTLCVVGVFLGLPGHATSWCGIRFRPHHVCTCRCCLDPFLEYGCSAFLHLHTDCFQSLKNVAQSPGFVAVLDTIVHLSWSSWLGVSWLWPGSSLGMSCRSDISLSNQIQFRC